MSKKVGWCKIKENIPHIFLAPESPKIIKDFFYVFSHLEKVTLFKYNQNRNHIVPRISKIKGIKNTNTFNTIPIFAPLFLSTV